MKDWVFSTLPFTVLHRRPIVKRIQAGFLAYGSSYCLPLPIPGLSKDSGSGKFRPRLQRRGRPRLSRGSLLASSHLNTDLFLFISYHNF
jgi:hypothetical protein